MIVSLEPNNKVLWKQFLHDFLTVLDEAILEEELQYNPYIRYLFYRKDDHIVVFLNYSLIYDRIEINQILVLEEFQKRGIASSLLEYLFALAKEHHIKNVTLEVKSDNVKAIRLYEKFGFEKKAIRAKYYNGVDGILMEKEMMK